MPDLEERKQQALTNLRNAIGRCVQEGFTVELYRGGDTIKTANWLAIYVDETAVTNMNPGETAKFSNHTLRYSPKE